MKRKLSSPGRARNMKPLPLLEWAESLRRLESARSYAAREIQHRGGYPASVANLYAELAGLNVGKD